MGLLLTLVAAGAVGVILFSWTREPSYQGRRLTQWLEAYHVGLGSVAEKDQAARAIQAMGKKAIPALLRMLQAQDSALKLKIVRLAQKQSLVRIRFTPDYACRWRAVEGFRALGPEAKEALPELVRLFHETNTTYEAAIALAALGPETLPHLRAGLTNYHESIRIASAQALREAGSNAVVAVPDLLARLRDKSYLVRAFAAAALGRVGQEANGVIPALAERLEDPNSTVRQWTIDAIAVFGKRATSAVPAIRKAMAATNQNDKRFLEAARRALEAIDSQAGVGSPAK